MDGEENNGFGPISEKRGQRAQACAAVLLVLCILLAGQYEDNVYVPVAQFLVCILAAVVGEVIKNTCLIVEELCHVSER